MGHSAASLVPLVAALAATLAAAGAGCAPLALPCADAADCAGAGPGATCSPEGLCAAPLSTAGSEGAPPAEGEGEGEGAGEGEGEGDGASEGEGEGEGEGDGSDTIPGPPAPFAPWGYRQPDDDFGEDCLGLVLPDGAFGALRAGKWADYSCGAGHAYACDGVTTPFPTWLPTPTPGRYVAIEPLESHGDAAQVCAVIGGGGRLARPANDLENANLLAVASTGAEDAGRVVDALWLGADDDGSAREGDWRWSATDEPLPAPLKLWALGRPEGGPGADCLALRLESPLYADIELGGYDPSFVSGELVDADCAGALPSVCTVSTSASCRLLAGGAFLCPQDGAAGAAGACADAGGALVRPGHADAARRLAWEVLAEGQPWASSSVWLPAGYDATAGEWRWADASADVIPLE